MNKTQNLVSLMGGALVGAAVMYLLDPELGRRRRRYIAEQTGEYLGPVGETLQSGWEKVAQGARSVGQTVAEKAQEYGQNLTDIAQDYGQRLSEHARDVGSGMSDRAGDAGDMLSDATHNLRRRGRSLLGWLRGKTEDYRGSASDVAENITDYGNRLWGQVSHLGKRIRRGARERMEAAREAAEPSTPVMPITMTAVGCCAIGAGLMFLMDPQRGRARRAWLADKLTSSVRRTGRSFYRTGQDLANRAYGTAVETRSKFQREPISSEQLLQRVRSEMGRAVSHPRLVQVMTDANGTVTLSGRVLASETDRLVSTVESIRGVRLVINRLEPKNTEQELNTGQNPTKQSVPQM